MKRLVPFAGGMACAIAVVAPAWSADVDVEPASACAVSSLNGKLEVAGGYYEDQTTSSDGRGHGAASLSMPFGCMWGVQVDGAYGALGDAEAGGVGAHVFTRDPERYLFGIYGSYSVVDDVIKNDIFRIGGEAEFYRGQFSVEAVVGYEDADFGSDDWFASAIAAFYVTDNLRLAAGYRHFLSNDVGVASLEWQPDITGMPVTLFAEAQAGSDDYVSAIGGVRFYFGAGDKSLKRRHREDDPNDLLMLLLASACGGKFLVGDYVGDDDVLVFEDSCGQPIDDVVFKSDRRLKRDIRRVGRLDNGLALYSFRYLWSDTVYVGVMAQEVLDVMPQAVVTRPDGYMAVKYSLLGTRMMTLAEWSQNVSMTIAA